MGFGHFAWLLWLHKSYKKVLYHFEKFKACSICTYKVDFCTMKIGLDNLWLLFPVFYESVFMLLSNILQIYVLRRYSKALVSHKTDSELIFYSCAQNLTKYLETYKINKLHHIPDNFILYHKVASSSRPLLVAMPLVTFCNLLSKIGL